MGKFFQSNNNNNNWRILRGQAGILVIRLDVRSYILKETSILFFSWRCASVQVIPCLPNIANSSIIFFLIFQSLLFQFPCWLLEKRNPTFSVQASFHLTHARNKIEKSDIYIYIYIAFRNKISQISFWSKELLCFIKFLYFTQHASCSILKLSI